MSQIAFSTAADAFVCTDSDAFVDWLGVGFDADSGPCPVTASVTDGVGTTTAHAEASSADTIAMDFSFSVSGGSSFFSGDVESAVVAAFDVDADGADLVFQSSGPTTATYSLAGPGTAVIDAPFPGAPLTLTTPGSYEISIHQMYNGAGTATPFFASASVTFVSLAVPVPIGPAVPLVAAVMLAGLGASSSARRRFARRRREGGVHHEQGAGMPRSHRR